MDAEVRQLFLFHLDPAYPDDRIDQLHRHALDLIKARRHPLICKIAREGYCIDLDSDG
jgi:hypothetical protein